jgi:hypothetical protein
LHRLARTLAAGALVAAAPARPPPPPQQSAAPPSAIPRLLVYGGDLVLIEEIEPVVLPKGRTTVRLDFVRGNADVNSLDVTPLDRPGEVRVASLFRRDDLGNATFVELDCSEAGPERLRMRYAAHGISTGVAYTASWNAARGTLDLVQELEVVNGSGEDFQQADVRAVFGDVHLVASTAVLHGRAPDVAPGPAVGLPAPALKQDLQEHTLVAFGAPVALPDGVNVRRRTLDLRELPATLEWRYDPGAWGGRPWRVAKVANVAAGVGTPTVGLGGITLQPGSLFLVEREGDATPAAPERFVRGGSVPHTPPGKELELDLGPIDDWRVERTQTDVVRGDLVFGDYNKALVSYSEEEATRLEIRNHADASRTLVVVEHVATATFDVVQSSVPSTRKDQTTLEFKVEAPARGSVDLTWRLKKTNLHP